MKINILHSLLIKSWIKCWRSWLSGNLEDEQDHEI